MHPSGVVGSCRFRNRFAANRYCCLVCSSTLVSGYNFEEAATACTVATIHHS